MTSIQTGWLGLPVVIVVVVALALAVMGVFYALVPPARRFIKGDRPVWWVRDGLIAVFVAVLVLFGHSYVLSAGAGDTRELGQTQERELSDLQFVRDRSSERYQVRPFRQFDLENMNLAGLELRGADFTGANLSRANLTGTDLRDQPGTPEGSGLPGEPPIPAAPGARALLLGVNLCDADLAGADLRNSNLVNANLTGADLTFAQLQGAALHGADLSTAILPSDPSYLGSIFYDDNTIWPEGFQPPPSNPGNKLAFLEDPRSKALYGDIERPACNS